MGNMTFLTSCSLRWHDVSLLDSVCFIVSLQALDRNEWGFFSCLLCVACVYVIVKSEVNFNGLLQLCPLYFLRSDLIRLECTVSAGLACQWASRIHLSASSLHRAFMWVLGSKLRFTCCVVSTSHLGGWESEPSAQPGNQGFLQKRNTTCFAYYLLGVVGWVN